MPEGSLGFSFDGKRKAGLSVGPEEASTHAMLKYHSGREEHVPMSQTVWGRGPPWRFADRETCFVLSSTT